MSERGRGACMLRLRQTVTDAGTMAEPRLLLLLMRLVRVVRAGGQAGVPHAVDARLRAARWDREALVGAGQGAVGAQQRGPPPAVCRVPRNASRQPLGDDRAPAHQVDPQLGRLPRNLLASAPASAETPSTSSLQGPRGPFALQPRPSLALARCELRKPPSRARCYLHY
eukprot:1662002-Rhodomonas_salina.1